MQTHFVYCTVGFCVLCTGTTVAMDIGCTSTWYLVVVYCTYSIWYNTCTWYFLGQYSSKVKVQYLYLVHVNVRGTL